MKYFFLFAVLAFTAQSAFADVSVRFVESAPKDRFVISTDCAVTDLAITIDLSQSNGSLIFDVTSEGAGVEVFQPVEVQTGTASITQVLDGDQTLGLTIDALSEGADIIISADLDDVLTNSSLGQIRVSGSELDGATIVLVIAGQSQRATFEDGSNRVSFPQGCIS